MQSLLALIWSQTKKSALARGWCCWLHLSPWMRAMPAWQPAHSESKWTTPMCLWIGGSSLWHQAQYMGERKVLFSRSCSPPCGSTPESSQSHHCQHNAKKELEEKFANHKNLKILPGCGLHEGECNQVLPIHDKITKDRKNRSANQGCQGTGVPVNNYDGYRISFRNVLVDPASVWCEVPKVWWAGQYCTGSLALSRVATIVSLPSQPAVPHSLIEVHQRLRIRALEEDVEQATLITITDVWATRTRLLPCPSHWLLWSVTNAVHLDQATHDAVFLYFFGDAHAYFNWLIILWSSYSWCCLAVPLWAPHI